MLLGSRIVGGTNAPPNAYPFFAQWMRGCGGTLIHNDIVLTAGHCLTDPTALAYPVYIGNTVSGQGKTIRSISEYALHPRYDFEDSKAYDFILLKLNEPIYDNNPSIVQLNSDPLYPQEQQLMTVIGFGHTEENGERTSKYLQQVRVPVVTDCVQYYSSSQIRDHMVLCAGYPEGQRDSCQADSGGPLLDENNVQVGLVSWGRGCGRPNSPGVYARISTVYSWIQHQICMISAIKPSHCVDIQLDIFYDAFLREGLSWSILDTIGREVTKSDDSNPNTSSQSTFLSLPEGSYRLYLRDTAADNCCTYGNGNIAIYQGRDNEEHQFALVQADGWFQGERMIDFVVNKDAINDRQQMLRGFQDELAIPIYTTAPTKAPTMTPTLDPTFIPTSSPTDVAEVAQQQDDEVPSSTPSQMVLRIEIQYDSHADEIAWFLINKDRNQEVYALRFNKEQRNEDNMGMDMQLEVVEFNQTQTPLGDNYWFVIADAGFNGLCCEYGQGYVRIVNKSSQEEYVIWESDGQFQTFAEAHFELA